MYKFKIEGLLIYNNLLAGLKLISPTISEMQGFKKSQKTPFYPNSREILTRLY